MHFIDMIYYITILMIAFRIIIYDIWYMRIENQMLLLLSGLHILYVMYYDTFDFFSLIEALVIFMFLVILRHVMNLKYQKDTLGFGDIKLLTLIAFIMPLYMVPYVLFFASLSSLVVMMVFKISKIPFAPSIMMSCIGVFLWHFL